MRVPFILLASLLSISVHAQVPQAPALEINDFILQKSPTKNEVMVTICDQSGKGSSNLFGHVTFSLNGFKQKLYIQAGSALLPQPVDHSTFVYMRHESSDRVMSKLYYLMKKKSSVQPIQISWWIIIAVFFVLIFLGSIFRKLFFISVVLLALLFIFGSYNGLGINIYFKALLDGLKNLL